MPDARVQIEQQQQQEKRTEEIKTVEQNKTRSVPSAADS